jgi:lysophospholipase L1-like esterase
MLMNRFAKTGFFLLVVLLVASIGLNVLLYQRWRNYCLDLNSTRLDPLGLNSYSTEIPQHPGLNDKPLVVFFGDSRAADWIMPTQVKDVTFINRGMGAQTTAQALGRLPYHVLPLKAKMIVIQIGINDLRAIPLFPEQKAGIIAECKANIQQIVELSSQDGAYVILTTIFPLGQVPIERRPFWSDDVAIAINDVNQFISSLQSDKATILDTAKVLTNSEGITAPLYSKDFLHLNVKGYEALNRELVRCLGL